MYMYMYMYIYMYTTHPALVILLLEQRLVYLIHSALVTRSVHVVWIAGPTVVR